jgi:hypothetical protein
MGILHIDCGFGFRPYSAPGSDGTISSTETGKKISPEIFREFQLIY